MRPTFIVLGLLVCLWPTAARAGGFAGAEGTVWAKVSFSRWTADKKLAGPFDRDLSAGIDLGTPIEFDPSTKGSLDTRSLSIDLTAVVWERTTVGVFIPVFQQVTFSDTTFESTTTGTGDVFVFLGRQVTPTGQDVGVSLRLKAKIPTTTPARGFEFIPLSEGQIDVAVEQETTWAPLSGLHLGVRTLLRHRRPFEDDADQPDPRTLAPGDEAELGLEIGGGPLPGVWLKLGYAGLWSTGSEDRSGRAAVSLRAFKAVHEAYAGAYLAFGGLLHPSLGGLALDLGLRHPFFGQDYPFGLTWSAGLAIEAQLWEGD